MAAAENLADQVLLADIAITDKDRSVRLEAAKMLTDERALADVAIRAPRGSWYESKKSTWTDGIEYESRESKFQEDAAGVAEERLSGIRRTSGSLAVLLTTTGPNKINVIKAICEVTGFELKKAKDLADHPPQTIMRAANLTEAKAIAKKFMEIGARVEIE